MHLAVFVEDSEAVARHEDSREARAAVRPCGLGRRASISVEGDELIRPTVSLLQTKPKPPPPRDDKRRFRDIFFVVKFEGQLTEVMSAQLSDGGLRTLYCRPRGPLPRPLG